MERMSKELGVAFVGCAHPHIFPRWNVLSSDPDVEFIGLYDPEPELAKELEKRLSMPAFEDPEELIKQPNVDIVIIEGWETHNPDYVRSAIAQDKDIFLEKPGTVGLKEVRALVDELLERQAVFQIGYQLRYAPVIRKTQEILQEDVTGPITLVRFHASAPVGGAREIWQCIPENLGGFV